MNSTSNLHSRSARRASEGFGVFDPSEGGDASRSALRDKVAIVSRSVDELTEHVFQQLKPFLSNKLITVDINDTITAHGSNPEMFDNIVLSICSFEDLCKFGKAFIENRVPRHIDYHGEFGKAEDSNGHGIEAKNLAKIHDYNVLTTNGQCNLKLDDEEQRGYLDFYCDTTVANKLTDRLFNDSRVYTVDFGSIKNERRPRHNFKCNSMSDWQHVGNEVKFVKSCKYNGCVLNLTKYIHNTDHDGLECKTKLWEYCSNLSVARHPMDMFDPKFPNIRAVLTDKIFFSIACREYGAPVNCSDVLLEHLKDIHHE